MLGKLIKYEIKATGRIFLPLYLVLIVFAVINHFMSFNADNFTLPQGITLTIYMFILVGMFVASFIVMIQRFYKNLLSEEGYLMFTLPVKAWKHIISKLIVSSMWTILSVLVAVISIIIIALQAVSLSDIFEGINMVWSLAYEELGSSLYLLIIQMVIGIIVTLSTSTLIIYASISIGQLSNNHKILVSIGSFLGLYTLSQIVASLVFLVPLVTNQGLYYHPDQLSQVPHGIIWASIALSAVFASVYYVVTNTILNKRLNLE